jgi:TM2 domain-containing membrane protein YozV
MSVQPATPQRSTKSALVAFFLCLFLGFFGVHRFYLGRIKSGLLMLFTLGGLGVWLFIDLWLIAFSKLKDGQGQIVQASLLPKSIILILSLALFGSVAYFVNNYITLKNIEASIQAQLQAFRANDVEQAYSYTSSKFKANTSLDDLKRFLIDYDTLKNNRDLFISKKGKIDNEAEVAGSLLLNDGSEVHIEYQLEKEDGSWKIGLIKVDQVNLHQDNDRVNKIFDNVSSRNMKLPGVYESKPTRYFVRYPEEWDFDAKANNVTVFENKKLSLNQPYVYIQVVSRQKPDGTVMTAKEVADLIKNKVTSISPDVEFVEEGTIELPQNPSSFQGVYFISENSEGQEFKEISFIILRDDSPVAYIWEYIAPADKFEADLPIAKAIFESWVIY